VERSGLPGTPGKAVKSKRKRLYHKTGRLLRQILLFLGIEQVLAYIASSKEAMKIKSLSFFIQIVKAYESCRSQGLELKISKDEQKVINDQRWNLLRNG
jgi:hypothetical protein